MTSGPKHKWITPEVKKIFNFALFISFVLFLIIFLFKKNENNFLLNIILLFSLYLIAQTILDLYQDLKNGNFNLSRFVSHFGFGLLIFFISINYIFSIENNFNVKVGEKKIVKDYVIKFKNLETLSKNNYQSVIGYFEIQNKNQLVLENLTPEIRIYNKPEIITYEASIKSKFFSDTYLTMSNISNTDIFNIKFQKKTFMNFIWLSVLLISVGGVLNFFSRKKI